MPPTTPTPAADGSAYDPYGAAAGSTALPAISDIFSLDQIGDKEVPLALASRGSFGPASLPHGVQRDAFARANDVPMGGPLGPVSDTIKNIVLLYAQRAYTSPQEFTALQQTLFAGGFYGGKKATDISWGSWGADTKDALVQALVDTAQLAEAGAPVTFSDYIKDRADKRSSQAEQQPTQVVSTTDPAAAMQAAQDAAEKAIGRRLTAEEAGRFATNFHSAEDVYNSDQLAAQNPSESPLTPGGSGVPTNAAPGVIEVQRPDLGSRAQQYVESTFGHEFGAERGASYITALQSMLTGGA